MIRVLLVAASPVVRAGLEALLRPEPGVELVGRMADLPTALDAAASGAVDVLVADVDAGEDVLPPTPAGISRPAMVLLVDEPPLDWLQDALRSGVQAVLPRNVTPEELRSAIEAAAAGLVVLHPQVSALLFAPAGPRTVEGGTALSPREMEVLRLLAEGTANKEIAWRLGISEHTAKFHVASILTKLGADTRTEAVTLGLRRGLILL